MREADGDLAFIPPEYHDDPEGTRDSVRRLLGLPFEVLAWIMETSITVDPHDAPRKLLR
jgi:hypothetical protein